MLKVTKEGKTKFIDERDLQDYENMGFKQENHKPEPMVIDEPETKKSKAKE